MRLLRATGHTHHLAGDRSLVNGTGGLNRQAMLTSGGAESCVSAAMETSCPDEQGAGNGDVGQMQQSHSRKPGLPDVTRAETAFSKETAWPRISVVVCSHNGARTIHETLEGLRRLDYPKYEIIVVNDGSTDTTASIAREYGFRLVSTEHRGLSHARNTGMDVAHGEIVAYISDDAYPDAHWLTYLAATFLGTNHAGVGGPNLTSADDGWLTDSPANPSNGPTPVFFSDYKTDHLPGCNMAFRKSTLQSIGGFDPRYRVAGDNVDVCWRLQQRGWTLGFHPAAVVRHRQRHAIRSYWNQQKECGRAEALLEEKWPQKYNELGHPAWVDRRDDHARDNGFPQAAHNVLTMMPEWYLLIGALTILAVLSVLWAPLLYSLPLLVLAIGAPIVQAAWRTHTAVPAIQTMPRVMRLKHRFYTAFLHWIQPIARFQGRLAHTFTHWRQRKRQHWVLPWPRTISRSNQKWQENANRLQSLEAALYDASLRVQRGDVRSRWDLEVGGGLFGKVRTLMTVTDHDADGQNVRVCVWPVWPLQSMALSLLFMLLSIGAIWDQAYVSATILACVPILAACRMVQECTWAMSGVIQGLTQLGPVESPLHKHRAGGGTPPGSPPVGLR